MSQPRDTMVAANAFDDDQWLSEPPEGDSPTNDVPKETPASAAMCSVWPSILSLAIVAVVSIVMFVKWLSQ